MDGLFDKIKEDLKKGIEDGIAVVKEGASVLSEKMDKLTTEGKRQYKMFDLKLKIQSQMTELGGKTYEVLALGKSLDSDKKIKSAFTKIRKLEDHLGKLEEGKEKKAASPRKPARKAKSTPKETTRVSAKKTGAKTVKKASTKK